MSKKFSIIVVCYERYYNVQCLIYSLLSQTYDNFEVILIHDGYNTEHRQIIEPYLNDKRFKYIQTDQRYNDWGMTLRNIGLKEATGEWVINTNDDNYYVPVYLEELNKVIESNQECNFIYYDCVLNHHNIINHNKKDYGLFINIEDGVTGLLHISEIGGETMSLFNNGDKITVQINRIDVESMKVFLKMPE